MQMSIFYTSFLVLVSLSTWKLSCEATELNKPTNLPKLCAETFLYYWNSCCDHQCGVNAYKRTLGLKGLKIPAEKAIAFLDWKRSHVLYRRTGQGANAVEECCKEGCSFEEVAEYPC